jgi:hypothetical protein
MGERGKGDRAPCVASPPMPTVEPRSQLFTGARELRADRAGGHTASATDLGRRQALLVAQQQQRAVGLGERAQLICDAARELEALEEDIRAGEGLGARSAHFTCASRRVVGATVACVEAHDAGEECAQVARRVGAAPQQDCPRVLGEVLGFTFVPRESLREAQEPRVVRGELGLGGR